MNDVEIVRFLSQIKGAIGDSINRDEAGRENWVGLFGGRVVGQRAAQISVSFEYNIASRATNTTTTGTGSVTHDSSASQAVVSTGSGIGTARLETVDTLRYRSSHDLYTYMTVVFTESEPHSHQRIGFLTIMMDIFLVLKEQRLVRHEDNQGLMNLVNLIKTIYLEQIHPLLI